jgi:hypothetical protein
MVSLQASASVMQIGQRVQSPAYAVCVRVCTAEKYCDGGVLVNIRIESFSSSMHSTYRTTVARMANFTM